MHIGFGAALFFLSAGCSAKCQSDNRFIIDAICFGSGHRRMPDRSVNTRQTAKGGGRCKWTNEVTLRLYMRTGIRIRIGQPAAIVYRLIWLLVAGVCFFGCVFSSSPASAPRHVILANFRHIPIISVRADLHPKSAEARAVQTSPTRARALTCAHRMRVHTHGLIVYRKYISRGKSINGFGFWGANGTANVRMWSRAG